MNDYAILKKFIKGRCDFYKDEIEHFKKDEKEAPLVLESCFNELRMIIEFANDLEDLFKTDSKINQIDKK